MGDIADLDDMPISNPEDFIYYQSLNDDELIKAIDRIKNENKDIVLNNIITGIKDYYLNKGFISQKQKNVLIDWCCYNG